MGKPVVKLHFPAKFIPAYTIPTREMEVTTCGQCPYCQSNNGHGEPALCTHEDAPTGFYANATGIWCSPPDWCPGRKS